MYSIAKRDLENYAPVHILTEEVKGVGMIAAFGPHLLPYPGKLLLNFRKSANLISAKKFEFNVAICILVSESFLFAFLATIQTFLNVTSIVELKLTDLFLLCGGRCSPE